MALTEELWKYFSKGPGISSYVSAHRKLGGVSPLQ